MARCESRPGTIGPITLGTKQTGAPSAGNPHAGCDVAGAGNGITVRLLRHSQRKRGATSLARPSEHRASPRPYRLRAGDPRDLTTGPSKCPNRETGLLQSRRQFSPGEETLTCNLAEARSPPRPGRRSSEIKKLAHRHIELFAHPLQHLEPRRMSDCCGAPRKISKACRST